MNNKWRIDTHMRNRPGRIFYSLTFGGLDKNFIVEFCQDNLKDKSAITGVLAVAGHFGKFTFDMLKALVEEMNRYGEPAADAMKWLNINPEDGGGANYTINVTRDGKELGEEWSLGTSIYDGNPLSVDGWLFYLNRYEIKENGSQRRVESVDMYLNHENIQNFDPETGTYTFTFEDKPGFLATLTRYVPAPRNFAYY